MPVIKAAPAAEILRNAVVLDLGDVARQAERLRLAAEERARQILLDAQFKAKRLIESASAKGFEQGRAEGLEKGAAEGRQLGRAEALAKSGKQFQDIQVGWLAAAEQWEAQRQTLDRQGREAVLELALRLTERLVHRVIQVDRQVIVDQASAALAHVLSATDVSIRVSPTDRPALEEALPQLQAELTSVKHMRIVDDPQIAPGGCIIAYGQGCIDATLDTQLQRIVDLMLPEEQGQAEEKKGPGPGKQSST